jgi:hypothetical protein
VPGRCRVTAVSTPLLSRAARADLLRSEVARLIEEAVGRFATEGRRVLIVIAPSHSPRPDAAQVPAALQRAERAPRDRDRCRLANAPRKSIHNHAWDPSEFGEITASSRPKLPIEAKSMKTCATSLMRLHAPCAVTAAGLVRGNVIGRHYPHGPIGQLGVRRRAGPVPPTDPTGPCSTLATCSATRLPSTFSSGSHAAGLITGKVLDWRGRLE